MPSLSNIYEMDGVDAALEEALEAAIRAANTATNGRPRRFSEATRTRAYSTGAVDSHGGIRGRSPSPSEAAEANDTISGFYPGPESLPENPGVAIKIEDAIEEDKLTMLCLAHFGGWSADRLARTFKRVKCVDATAEEVWDFHERSMADDKKRKQIHDAIRTVDMRNRLNKLGAFQFGLSLPMHETPRPVTVKFAAAWSKNDANSAPLFPGFTFEAQNKNREYIAGITVLTKYGELTPIEADLLEQFGPHMSTIVIDALRAWAEDMCKQVMEVSDMLEEARQVQDRVITKHLDYFKFWHDEVYGKLGLNDHTEVDDKVVIRSTGAGARYFLRLIMEDRHEPAIEKLEVEHKRIMEKVKIGFVEVAVSDLPEGEKDCSICLDPIDAEGPDGERDTAIKLAICCNKIIGKVCLKKWLCEPDHLQNLMRTCPMCRYRFPDSFLRKLFRDGPGPRPGMRPGTGLAMPPRQEREGAPTPESEYAQELALARERRGMAPPDHLNYVESFYAMARASPRI